MPQLRKGPGVRPLLKRHLPAEPPEMQLPAEPSEDIDRSPESSDTDDIEDLSDDEGFRTLHDSGAEQKPEANTTRKSEQSKAPQRRSPRKRTSGNAASSPSTNVGAGQKRKREDELERRAGSRNISSSANLDDDPDAAKFESFKKITSQTSRPSQTYASLGSKPSSTPQRTSSQKETKAANGFKTFCGKTAALVKPDLPKFTTHAPLTPVLFRTDRDFKDLSSPLPEPESYNAFNDNSTALSSPSPSPEPQDPPNTVRCPLCNGVVSLSIFPSARTAASLAYSRAVAFCESHKALDAQDSLKKGGYPKVDWDGLEERLSRHHDTLRAVLSQQVESSYRRELQVLVDSGTGRNALRNPDQADKTGLGRASMGYYGRKGARRLTEHIMQHLSEDIRSVAGGDSLFAEVGVPGYVQAVLVPELVVLLVREDYDCDEDRAREVLKDSAELGEGLGVDEKEELQNEKTKPEQTNGEKKRRTPKKQVTPVSKKKKKADLGDGHVIEIFSQESVVAVASPRQTRASRR